MGIDETALCGGEVMEIVLVEGLLVFQAVLGCNPHALRDNLLLHGAGYVGASFEGLGLVGIVLVTDGDGLALLDREVHPVAAEAGDIGLNT